MTVITYKRLNFLKNSVQKTEKCDKIPMKQSFKIVNQKEKHYYVKE